MKTIINPKLTFEANFKKDYNRLFGEKAMSSYLQQKQEQQENNLDKDINDVYNVIYNSLENLALHGRYSAFKSLFKALTTTLDDEISCDYILQNLAGDVFKKGNDIAKAEELYAKAYKCADLNDVKNYLNIEKNYLDSLLTDNDSFKKKIEILKERGIPQSTVNYLELHSLLGLENGNTDYAGAATLTAYRIARNNNILSDDTAIKAATVLLSNGEFDYSIEVCKERLDKLKKEHRVFTYEFLNLLTLLAINNYHSKQDNEKIKNTFLNAYELESEVNSEQLREMIEYYLLRISFETPDEKIDDAILNKYKIEDNNKEKVIYKLAVDFIDNTENTQYAKELSNVIGDCYYKQNKEVAFDHYSRAITILKNNKEKNSEELVRLYTRLAELYPENKQLYDIEISNLGILTTLPLDNLIKTVELKADNISTIMHKVLEDSKSTEEEKQIAKTELLFLKLSQNFDFSKTTKEISIELETLDRMNSITQNASVARYLYNKYLELSKIKYDSSNYYESANLHEKAELYISMLDLSDYERAKFKADSTLLWYKNKSYYYAERECLDFLKLISKLDKVDTVYSFDISKLINGKTDEESRKIAATFETLGIINIKNKNYCDAISYYQKAIDIREALSLKDLYLANDYAAMARLAILGYSWFGDNLSSKDYHNKCLNILKDKYQNEPITIEEQEFHKKYYGYNLTSIGKFLGFRNDSAIIDNFKCYNKELNICE